MMKSERDFLESQGYQVIRFWNNQFEKEIDGVIQVIEMALHHK